MTIINEINKILNSLGLIGDCIKWIITLLDGMNPVILIILFFVIFLVVMFDNSIVTRKAPYKRYQINFKKNKKLNQNFKKLDQNWRKK